jgi:uncharacterized protein YecE (DUF72 family)
MGGNLPLFEDESPAALDRRRLAEKLRGLAGQGVYLGTSSWKYEGWLGTIYSNQRYVTRGKFSRKRFEEECLAEYAETFPAVCGDFSFYQFPTEAYWRRLFGSAPERLQFAFKVPEEITVKAWPVHPRYGPRAGLDNGSFLSHEAFEASFAALLRPYLRRVAVLIFEFGTFPRRCYENTTQFLAELDPFLEKLPRDFRYGVEIRNPEYLEPEYFECLRAHNVAHVFNAWSRMPEINRQIVVPGAFTADFTVGRALLRFGRQYEDAVDKFSPYRMIQDENPPTREGLRTLIERARERREKAWLFVNNRLEGNAPMTIDAIT